MKKNFFFKLEGNVDRENSRIDDFIRRNCVTIEPETVPSYIELKFAEERL